MENSEINKENKFDQNTEEAMDKTSLQRDNELVSDETVKNDSVAKETTDETPPQIEEIMSEEVKIQNHCEAIESKEEGNKFFKEGNYDSAISSYNEAIEKCPKSFPKTLAILYSNRAASYMKLEENEMAITDCTSALENDGRYTKARLRRALMYEATEKLDEALKDYNEILTYDKSCRQAYEASMRLPQQIQERNEKLKDEMFGKLKELGNMCLKPFGLSTENFKMTQDPNSGGYSINFQK